jgi:hypothetical protein
MARIQPLYDAILSGDALDGLDRRFECEDYFVPELLLVALLTVTMPLMWQTIEAIRQAGIRARIKTIVVGAPLTAQFAAEIGAAVALVRNLALGRRA